MVDLTIFAREVALPKLGTGGSRGGDGRSNSAKIRYRW